MILSNSSMSTSLLYPYGYFAGDQNNSFGDCNNGNVQLIPQLGVPFFNTIKMKIYVCTSYCNCFKEILYRTDAEAKALIVIFTRL
jgi:hypothetical protein